MWPVDSFIFFTVTRLIEQTGIFNLFRKRDLPVFLCFFHKAGDSGIDALHPFHDPVPQDAGF